MSFFSTAFLPAKKLSSPSPLPYPALTPPQTHFLPRVLACPLTPHFSSAPVLLLPQLPARGSHPGSTILARILTSLSSPGQSWHGQDGLPWEKAGSSDWGCGLRAQPIWAPSCYNHFKYDFLLLLLLIFLIYEEEPPLSEYLTTRQAPYKPFLTYLIPRQTHKVGAITVPFLSIHLLMELRLLPGLGYCK